MLTGDMVSEPDHVATCPECGKVDYDKCSGPTGVLGVEVTVHLFREPSAQSPLDRFMATLIGDPRDDLEEEQRRIAAKFLQLADMVLARNRRYGGAALNPVRIFSDVDPEVGIRLRLDDKMSRIRAGAADEDEDPIADAIGYMVLLLVHRDRRASQP